MLTRISFSVLDAFVVMITVLYMTQCRDDDAYVPLLLYGMSVVVICLIAAICVWR